MKYIDEKGRNLPFVLILVRKHNTISTNMTLIYAINKILRLNLAIIFLSVVLSGPHLLLNECGADTTVTSEDDFFEMADKILDNRLCPCQCGRYLPGNPTPPACFGCSVGKAVISRVLESLEAGRKPLDIVMDLNNPIIINVFSDYTNPKISHIWQLVKKVSAEFHQSIIVLRATGFTIEARRAIRLAECARLRDKFAVTQETMISHKGPWDWDTLLRLTIQDKEDYKQIQACLNTIDIDAQIHKDQQHAEEQGIFKYPTVSINNHITPNREQAIRDAIKKALLELSI